MPVPHTVVCEPHPSASATLLTAEFKRLFNALGEHGKPLPVGGVAKGLKLANWRRSRHNPQADVWEKSLNGISCAAVVIRATRKIGCIMHGVKPVGEQN